MVSVYAPTFRSLVEVKEKFFTDLQGTLDRVNEHDSERGGSYLTWNSMRGIHVIGKMNDAGVDLELLSFCALNELTIVNTH